MNRTIAVIAVLALTLGAHSRSLAAILSTDPDGAVVQVPPPASVLVGDQESDTDIIAFNEQQSVLLGMPLAVNISSPGLYDESSALTPGVIDAGAVVDSHFLHFDPTSIGPVQRQGSVTFTTPILGVIVLGPELSASDEVLGWPATMYPTDRNLWPHRGLEFDTQGDWIQVDGNVLTVHLDATCCADQVRVITESAVSLVSNLVAIQRQDASKIVDVSYDLAGEDSSYEVAVYISVNGEPYVLAGAVSGDVGPVVLPGTGRNIAWVPAHEVAVIVAGTVSIRLKINGQWTEATAEVDVDPPGPGNLEGHVHDPDGNPVQGAQVTLTIAAPGQEPQYRTTDWFGEFSFEDVSAGRALVTATKVGIYKPATRWLQIYESSTTRVNITLSSDLLSIQGPEVTEVTSQFCGPDRHIYYLEGRPLEEEFTAQIDWHEAAVVPPHEFWWYVGNEAEPRYEDLLVGPESVVSRPFEIHEEFEAGERLTVMAVAAAGTAAEWRSQEYVVNFDVVAPSPALPNSQLVADTSGSTLKYDLREDAVGMPRSMKGRKRCLPRGTCRRSRSWVASR